ncbi:hypothetical protein CCR75_008155 [Bremia lactucae]|uniref:Ig-like domain-containing protein n=1 Tax=Bremia lactucae TaxID=4779 RepID=A0A976FER3_BRELC|nr:hypothetical protein CCR75_008155 [Bremia lactucae]
MGLVCYGCIRGYYLYHPKSSSCPTCKVNLGAKPLTQILPDPAIKELAQKLLPNYTAKEEIEGSNMKKLRCSIHSFPINSNIKWLERLYYQTIGIKRKQPSTPIKAQLNRPIVRRSIGPSPGNMIQFELYPQRGPNVPLFLSLNKLETPWMYTQSLLKIMYLRKYLAKKLKLAKPEEIEILCKGTVVGPEYSLEFIRRTRWKEEDSKMMLEYRRQLIAS